VRRPFLGVRGRPARSGVLVEAVQPGTPAARAGIHGGDHEAIDERDGSVVVLGGDVLTRLAGRATRTMDDVHAALSTLHPGQKVEVELQRAGKAMKVTVQLGERPGAAAAE
jgi:S1-C subfamily serine protease